ncbi:XRE family transcriptional regulator [Fructobacillus cardui]|uniref:XRE family transcriptional regulator n=2 Tax=Fructobacillus TaxID=559173 RepID=UPI002DA392DF|nr:hypothetical protein R53653_IHELHDKM_01058 [Fructobacillus cardui]
MSVTLKFKDVNRFKEYIAMTYGETPTEFGKRVGINYSQMSGYMNGGSLQPKVAKRIAGGVKKDIVDIFLPSVLTK